MKLWRKLFRHFYLTTSSDDQERLDETQALELHIELDKRYKNLNAVLDEITAQEEKKRHDPR